MKKLVAPGTVVIPSGHPRTRRRDSRGIRICFAGLARSCTDMEGFYLFTDGSGYAYDPPSNTDAEDLCGSSIRGRAFNLGVRRAVSGFMRGFTPPPDYEIIYTFPPYLGTQPAQCSIGTLDWTMLVWDTYVVNQDPPGTISGSAGGDSFDWTMFTPAIVGNEVWISPVHASLTYTGPTQDAQLTLNVSAVSNAEGLARILVLQDGTPILDTLEFVPPLGVSVYPFTVNAGAGSLIEVVDSTFIGQGDFFLTGSVGSTDLFFSGVGTFSNV